MKKAVLTLACLLTSTAPSWAQAPAATPPTTVLHLSETQSVPVTADEIVARLDVTDRANSAAAAQRAVNDTMAKALTDAHAVAGITVSTGAYNVWQDTQKDRWQAHQALVLHGKDGPTMLNVVGKLQKEGLAVQTLGWQISDAANVAAGKAATMKALAALRQRAAAIAKVFDEHVAGFSRIDVNDGQPPSRPIPMLMAARAATAPSAVAPQDLRRSATITADVVLKP